MAMRPTPRSGGTLPMRPRPAAVRPVYEDFRPMTEWQQDEESNRLLVIYLPGFQREHLKVSTEGKNILRARGERLVAGNKYSRFQEDYPLSEDSNVRGIRARFEGGILTITIPRKREAEDAFKAAAKTTEDTPKPSQETREDLSSQRQPTPPKAAVEKMHQKVADDSSGPRAIPSVIAPDKGRDEKMQETLPDLKMLSEKTKKNLNEKPDISKEESELDRTEKALKKTIEETKAQKDKGVSAYEDFRPLKAQKPEKSEEESYYKKSAREKEKVPDLVENIMRQTTEKPKSQKGKRNIEPKEKKAAAASSSSVYGLANYMQAVKNFLDLNEERQLLVNIGAAVLVIIALGAYISYTFQEKLHDI